MNVSRFSRLSAPLVWLILFVGSLGTACSDEGAEEHLSPSDTYGEERDAGRDIGDRAPMACSEDSTCGVFGLCIDGSCSPQCVGDSECTNVGAPKCSEELGICAECSVSDDCADGRCESGRCAASCDPANDQCQDPLFCHPFERACQLPDCLEDDDCLGVRYCDDDLRTCEQPECFSDEQCPQGEDCVRYSCLGPVSCAPGERECIAEDIAGVCGPSGRWLSEVCDGRCVGAGECVDELNECGGTNELEHRVGDACGECSVMACANERSLFCDRGAENACGGCQALEAQPNDDCSPCGVWVCQPDHSVACSLGAPNACGSCGPLQGSPGTSCGTCGTWTCDAEGEAVCEDPGRNSCGGCQELDGFPGQACDDGVMVCESRDALSCFAGSPSAGTSASQCRAWGQRFRITNSLAIGYDSEIGCYLKGACSSDGPSDNDPFGATCRDGTICAGDLPIVGGGAGCTNCSSSPNNCRSGETCTQLIPGILALCTDPLNIPLPF